MVTERGRPVAILQSIYTVEAPKSPDARLAKLAASGLVTLPSGKLLKRVRRVHVAGPPVSRAIIEDRR